MPSDQRSEELPRGTPPQTEEKSEGLWRCVFLSGLIHLLVIWSLFLFPYMASSRAISYPVYSVDLVGGERLGGKTLEALRKRATPKKKIKKKKKVKQPKTARVIPSKPKFVPKKPIQRVKKKPKEKPAPVNLSKKATPAKKEPKKKEKQEGISDSTRERLIQAALNRVRERAEATKRKEVETQPPISGPREGSGAASLGEGGQGGGVLKGVEFLIYRNRMLQAIKDRWAWVGRRTDLEVTVRFGVRENGEIIALRITEPSGDGSYDDSVLRAVRKASPLGPPPENYRKDFMDVELTFRPKDFSK